MPHKVLLVHQALPKMRQDFYRWLTEAQRGLGEKYSLIFGTQFETSTILVNMLLKLYLLLLFVTVLTAPRL